MPHAGCPHQCVFCNQKAISGQKLASAEEVEKQITRYLQWIKPNEENEAAFYGGSFTGLPPSLQEELFKPVDKLMMQGIVKSVRLSTRPDYIDKEKLELLKKHGVSTIELGVQSLDDNVLRMSERGHGAEDVQRAVSLLKDNGFNVGVQLMVGMPGQDFASVKDTVRQVLVLKPDIARIYPLLVVKGTALEENFKKGAFEPLPLEEAVKQSAYMYQKLTASGINVIRVGLQADEELCSEGNILAGPFHPAFGELVQSYLLQEEYTPIIKKLIDEGMQELIINVPARMESKLRGLKNKNLNYWKHLNPLIKITVCTRETEEISISGK